MSTNPYWGWDADEGDLVALPQVGSTYTESIEDALVDLVKPPIGFHIPKPPRKDLPHPALYAPTYQGYRDCYGIRPILLPDHINEILTEAGLDRCDK